MAIVTATLEDGMVLTVEIGFATTAGDGTVPINSTLASITWTDVTSSVRDISTSRGRSSELDTYSAGSCSVILGNEDRHFDPENVPYVYLPGTSGNYVSTPDAAVLDITGDIDIAVRVAMTDWTPSATQALITKRLSPSNLSYGFFVQSTGRLLLETTGNGSTARNGISSVSPTVSDGQALWVRATRASSSGSTVFYTAPDSPTYPTSWTQLGTTISTTAGAIFAGTARLVVGSQSAGTSTMLNGTVYRAIVKNGIDGTAVADFDASKFATSASTTCVAETGETWTLNTSGSGTVLVAGPYYGKLTPLRPIRIRVTPSGGVIRSIFFGFIDQWPQAYSYPRDATVTVTATDAFKVLNQYKLPSYWNTTITAAAPTDWYPLADFNGSFYAFEIAKPSATSAQWMSSTANVDSSCTPGQALLAAEPATSSSFDGQKIVQIVDPISSAASLWTAEMWIQTTESTTGNYGIWNHLNFIHGGTCGLVVADGNATIVAQFGHRGTSNSMTTKNAQITVNDGKPHHVALVYQSDASLGNTFNLYVDGQLATVSDSYLDIVDNQYSFMTLGFPINKSATVSNNFPNYFKGSIQHLVLYSGVMLTAADVLAHYQIGAGTYLQGTRTDERITFLANLADWMTDGLDLGTGDTTVLGLNIPGKGLLDALKEVETAEQGRLFMSVDGKIKFVDRNSEGSGNFITSQATFSDKATGAEIAYSDITLTFDDRYIFNDITFSQPDGTSYNNYDSTSQGKYFKQTFVVDNFIADSGYFLVNAGLYKLAQYKDPQMRIDELTVNTRRSTAYQSPCTTLDIGDRITVKRTPQNVGSAISKSLIIEGIKHRITRDEWTVTFNTSPTLQNAPFVLDSATLGVLGTNILGY